MSESMELTPLIGSFTALDLWPLTNVALPAWILLAVFPRWKFTPTLTLIPPLMHAAIYTLGIARFMMSSSDDAAGDLTSLEGVVTLFRDPNAVFIGWVHYVAFDLLVGRHISIDAISRGASNPFYAMVIVPCLFLCLMAGPVGFLLYVVVRSIALPMPKEKTM